MLDFGISFGVMFAIAVGVVLGAIGFRAGVKLRFLDPRAPELTAMVGFVAGFLFAPALALGTAALATGASLLWLYKIRREVRIWLDRYLDRVAVEQGVVHRRRPFNEQVAEAEADHRLRMQTIRSQDYDEQLLQMLVGVEQERHRQVMTRLAEGAGRAPHA